MKYKAIAIPLPAAGTRITEKSQVVPDQSLSLAEILARFVRGEGVPVGHDAFGGLDESEQDHELDVDLEKLQHADMTEKEEWKEKAAELQKKYEREERRKQKADQAAKAAEHAAGEERRIEELVKRRVEGIVETRLKRPAGGPSQTG